jgi:hypothetical protein
MAIDFMGPPTASLNEGQTKIGYTYHWSKNDVTVNKIKIGNIETDLKADFEDLKVQRNYFTVNYGLASQRMEVYGFLGSSNIKNDDFDGGNDFAIGAGIKITTNINDNADWGILFQASWLKADDTSSVTANLDGDTISGRIDTDVHAVELQGALGPTVKVMEDWNIYGGIFGYWTTGDVKSDFSGLVNGEPGSLSISGDLENNGAVGGYIGTQVTLFNNVVILAEYEITENGEGVGGNISWRF